MTLLGPDRTRHSTPFADDLRQHGERVAVLTGEGSITYAALDERVSEVADQLGANRRLVLLTVRTAAEALVAYLAAMRGRHPVVLAPAGETAVRFLTDTYDPDVVITAEEGWEVLERRASTVHELHPDLALLLSTSGSTGSPKLVRLSHQNIHANAAAIAEYLGITMADRAITTLPMQYCYGLSVINSHLHAGATLVLTELSVVDGCFWDLFAASGVTSFAGVPHTFDLLDRVGFDSMSLPTLRYVTQAGGRMRPDKVRRFAQLGARRGWDLFVMYGQTEATARMAYLPPRLAASQPNAIGLPIPGGVFTIDAPDVNGIGELVYRGPNVMLGYAQQPSDLSLGPTLDRLHTGDLARVTPDGLYEVVGRRNRFIKAYGLRIDLDWTERLLLDHAVTAACTGAEERLIVGVEHVGDVDTVYRVVATELGLPRTHACVLVVGELPRLSNGKPDYATLQQLAANRCRAEAELAERGASDRAGAVRAAFVEILGVEPADDATFSSLGGDSLSYVEMSIRLEEIFGSLPRDWHTTPVGELVPGSRRRRFVAQMDTSAVVRAVTILLIVGTHTKLWHVPGGAHTLLAVAGYNFARFQLGATTMLASISRIAVPSVCWIAMVAAVSDKYGWPNALLLNGFIGRPGDEWGYWFIEALVQILLPLAAVFAVPVVARFERQRPFAVAGAAVAVGLLLRFDVLIDPASTYRTSRPHEVFWLFALGWAAARATCGRQRLVVSALAAAAAPGFFGNAPRELLILAGILLIVWMPTLPVPRFARAFIAPVAGASLYIYLTHFQVHPPFTRNYGPLIGVAVSLVVGVVTWSLARRVIDRCQRWLREWTPNDRADTTPEARVPC